MKNRKFEMKIIIMFIAIILINASCSEKTEQLTKSTDYIEASTEDTSLHLNQKILYYDSLLFSGKVIHKINGVTLKISEYKDGILNGNELTFYENGNLKEERWYINGSKEGEHKGWWENGKLRFVFKNDVFDGSVMQWNIDGMLFSEFNYLNGQEEGLQRAWFPNGDVQANYVAKNNRKYGITGVKFCKSDF
jgi:antitoxin component YwqK of YwqJK toxin-antitoxin module